MARDKEQTRNLQGEFGVSRGQIERTLENVKRVKNLTSSDSGKYTILCIDKFDGEDFVYGHRDTEEEALNLARDLTRKAMSSSSDASVATVFYAYDPKGNYLGGDVWNNE